MLFNSYSFLFFFPIVLMVFFVIPARFRYLWLLVASYYFYMSWNPKYIVLIVFSTLVTWGGARLLCGREGRKRKAILIICILLNLAVLFFFKYFRFALDTVNLLVTRMGMQPLSSGFDVMLPVGISFYTFQALSYVIDVYRGETEAEKNLLLYASYVSFFPQLVAGPIERSSSLMQEIKNLATEKKIWDYNRVKSGAFVMLWGYFLKMVVADHAAVLADEIFNHYTDFGTAILILGVLAFALQIYCDFAAYSTIALGTARIMNIRLMDNFDTPYFALSVREFWHRWHISLSTWFRDYVYIPLGGSRCSKARKYFNIMVTFMVSGLWHGANWTFVLWGMLHGFFQILEDLLEPVIKRINRFLQVDTTAFSYKLLQWLFTFACVCFAWIFFRAETVKNALNYIVRMFTWHDPWVFYDETLYSLGLSVKEVHVLLFSVLLILAVGLAKRVRNIRFDEWILKQNLWFRVLLMSAGVMFIVLFGKYGLAEDASAFIYFQF